MRVTHGCIRMLPDDVENLFDQVAVGTRVRLVNEPLKLGWSDEHLYVQAYPYLDEEEGAPIEDMTAAIEEVEAAHQHLADNANTGKLLLRVAAD